jgi:signal transduction histidine kinase
MIKSQLDNYVNADMGGSSLPGNYQLLESGDNYNLYRIFDDRIGSNYLELFGKLGGSNYVYLRVNYQNMKESVTISNKFIGYIGIVVLLVGALCMFFVGRRFTKPILELADIADKMAKLDFDAKYEVRTSDEIGRLGSSMNTLSGKLEETISELKSANNELQYDIEKKVQIDEMRQEFLSNVSHELKTPIALIQGYAEGLQDDVIDNAADRKFYCEVIMDEAQKMNRMVKRLLDLNQLEFGTETPNMERFDVVEVIKSVVAASDILFKQKNVELIMYEPHPVYVWAEEYLVEEVLTNYVSNAFNHLKEPNRIQIYTKNMGEVVRIGVRNTGDRIPEDELDKIWEKFYKVDKARTREYGGNGIGLSIVKAILRSFNRECGVKNCEDGVEFWFELDAGSNT